METHVLQWMTSIGTFLGPIVIVWIQLVNRKRNVAQAQKSHAAIESVGEKVNIVEAKVEQVVGQVADVGSQVVDVNDTVQGNFAKAQATHAVILQEVAAARKS